MALSAKQAIFVAEYLKDLNATQAALRAGYSEKTATLIGHENLRKPNIQSAIKEQMDARSSRTEITTDRVLLEIARLAFNDPRKAFDKSGALLPVHDFPDEIAAAISSIKVTQTSAPDGTTIGETKEIKFWDKGKQLDLAARHLGMLTDKLEVGGNVTLVMSKQDIDL